MSKSKADCGSEHHSRMPGVQVIGLDGATFHCGQLLEEGLKLLADYRGEQETLLRILMNLSQGFELLLKLTLWLIGEKVPKTHDVPRLLDAILLHVSEERMPPGRRRFLEEDRRFRNLMTILGKYGGPGKYSFLDAATGDGTDTLSGDSPTEMWEKMKLDLLDDNWLEAMERNPRLFWEQYYPHLYEVVATSLAKGIHGLWWLWVHGPTAARGRQWHVGLTHAAGQRVNGLVLGF